MGVLVKLHDLDWIHKRTLVVGLFFLLATDGCVSTCNKIYKAAGMILRVSRE